MADKVGRNPHPDFKKVEASREEWDTSASSFRYTKTANPDWKFGDGANRFHDEDSKAKKHIAIDPYTPGRPWGSNYKLLISGDCETVKCARVKEAVFSIEAKLDYVKEYDSRVVEGRKGGTIAILEVTRFWVREDALNEDQNLIDISVLKPMSRLGGITYGRTTQGIELLRPGFEKDVGGREGAEKIINDTKV
uniref:Uncharacterized protein n=1 Tax=Bionectria ochroleuca TaxID=29856 RepID=A0A0B7JL33_BIOOC